MQCIVQRRCMPAVRVAERAIRQKQGRNQYHCSSVRSFRSCYELAAAKSTSFAVMRMAKAMKWRPRSMVGSRS